MPEKTRTEGDPMMDGNQPTPKWGINNDYAKLHHVLLGKPEYYRWVEAGPLIG